MAKTRKSKKKEIRNLHRGDIWLVSLDPTVGHEIKKTRPALIIQNNIGNKYSSLTIIAPITSKISPLPYPVEVVIDQSLTNGLGVKSAIRLDQIRTIDRLRLIKYIGKVNDLILNKVNEAIKISLGLIEF